MGRIAVGAVARRGRPCVGPLRFSVGAALALALLADPVRAQQIPDRVSVKPVFIVPRGEREPTAAEHAALLRHLRISRDRYTVMLGRRDSFALDLAADVVPLSLTLPALRAEPHGGAPAIVADLLRHYRITRYQAPWVFVAIVMNDEDDFPIGAGQPINGGLNNGGGFIEMSSYALNRIPNVQSTFQHELGHAFGLPHVDAYGRDMGSDSSIMSYNPSHHTRGFAPSRTPGILLREDLRALAQNHRVFPALTWDTAGALGAKPPELVMMGAMSIASLAPPSPIAITTTSGSLYGSSPGNVLRGEIVPSPGPAISFDQARMWHSDSANAGWVELDLTFPDTVELTSIEIHSGHSGQYHLARRVRVSVMDASPRELADAPLAGMDATVTFPATRGRRWRVSLQSGARKLVVVRGLQFFDGATELFPR